MQEKSNIVLLGMPGSGKSTVGVLLAKRLGKRFIDTDLLIQEQEGRLLSEIIKEEGLENFIAIEKVGRRSVYTPLVSKQDYLAARSRSFIDTLCGGSLPTFAAALCEGGLTREELQELRALLERDEL